MKSILIIGGTGLLGKRISSLLSDKYEISILSRKLMSNTVSIKYFQWNPDNEEIDLNALSADVIINLAGEGIADKRWTADRKKALIDSRVKPAAFIARTLRQHNIRPKLYIGASAIGIYGDRSDEALTESSSDGQGFMVDCCRQWENASNEMLALVDRLLILRIGIVLTTQGGALPKLAMTSSLGVLNYFGNGAMYYSWIHIDDIVGIIETAIDNAEYSGVVNAVAPKALTNKKFMQVMAESMAWPKLVLPAPLFAIKLALGEMAAVVLNSNNVVPSKLNTLKYNYRFPRLLEALQDLQKRKV
jgi:uncharacterized protein